MVWLQEAPRSFHYLKGNICNYWKVQAFIYHGPKEEVVAFTSLQKVSRPAKEDGQILTICWPDGQNLTIYDGQNMTILTVVAICVLKKSVHCFTHTGHRERPSHEGDPPQQKDTIVK